VINPDAVMIATCRSASAKRQQAQWPPRSATRCRARLASAFAICR
jgi:hypothetical protein